MNWNTRRRFRRNYWAVFALLCSLSSGFSQTSRPQYAHLSLISDQNSLVPGTSNWIGLRFELEPGWHIYWTNPGDSGEPPRIAWHLSPGIQAGDLEFPAPQRIPDHSLTDYGYQGNVVLVSKLTISVGAASKQAEIGADVKYLVCREVCVPGKDHLSITVPLGSGGQAAAAASQIQSAVAHLPQPLPREVRVSARSSPNSFILMVADRSSGLGIVTDFIPADEQVIDNNSMPAIDRGKDEVVIKLKKSEQIDHPISQLRGLLIAGGRAYNIGVPVNSSKTNPPKSRPKAKE